LYFYIEQTIQKEIQKMVSKIKKKLNKYQIDEKMIHLITTILLKINADAVKKIVQQQHRTDEVKNIKFTQIIFFNLVLNISQYQKNFIFNFTYKFENFKKNTHFLTEVFS
jgi:hypothetical protein